MSDHTKAAIAQLFEWARAYVENETTIPETHRSELTDAEKGALLLMDLWDLQK